jgi:hypothetical protein
MCESRALTRLIYVQADTPFYLSQRQTVTSRNWTSCGISGLADGAHFAEAIGVLPLNQVWVADLPDTVGSNI